jgi:sugar lactone lactonase YvrE
MGSSDRILATFIAAAVLASPSLAQQTGQDSGEFVAGLPLGVGQGADFGPMSDNVKVFGTIVNAESCVYDAERQLILAVSRGANQNQVQNDAHVSLINHDGSVHTAKWIGATRDGLVLNHPFGSDIAHGRLYVADRDGGTNDEDPSVSVLRMFDMQTGAPVGEIRSEQSTGFNDIEVAEDGTIYATQTGAGGESPDTSTWRVYAVTEAGETDVLIEGPPLNRPNGIGIDGDGNLVVVNIGDDAILTFTTEGELLDTRRAAQAGSDGLVILEDGTIYVSSVIQGGITRLRPGGEAELIATGIPSAASMCHDAGGNQLVIPMNMNHALAFVPLE